MTSTGSRLRPLGIVMRGGFPHRCVIECLEPSEIPVEFIEQVSVVIIGWWSSLVDNDHLDPLPHAPCFSGVMKVTQDFATLMVWFRSALTDLRSTMSPVLKAAFCTLNIARTSVVSEGLWLAQVVMSLVPQTSSINLHIFRHRVSILPMGDMLIASGSLLEC